MAGIAKPQLRGLFMSQAKRHLVGATVLSVTVALLYKYLYFEPKQQRYHEFYKNYDDEKQLKIMNEAGLMQSYKVEEEKK